MSTERTDALPVPMSQDTVEHSVAAARYIDTIEQTLGHHFERFLRLSPEGRQIAFSTAFFDAVGEVSSDDLMLIGTYIQWFGKSGSIKRTAEKNGVPVSKLRSLIVRMPEMLARFYDDRVSIASISLHETVHVVSGESKPDESDVHEMPGQPEETSQGETLSEENIEQSDEAVVIPLRPQLMPKRIPLQRRPSSPPQYPHLPQRSYLRSEPVAPPPIDERNWRMHALCNDADPEIFFPDKRNSKTTAEAKRICRGCLVANQCLKEELARGPQHQWGVRAGLTSRERRAILRKLKRV